jgi:hypothetical protein
VAGWVLPCPSSLLTRRWGLGGREQPLQMTNVYFSHVLSSTLPEPLIPNFSPYPTITVIAFANSLHPVPTPIPGPPEARRSSCPASGSSGRMRSSRTDMTASQKPLIFIFTYMTSPSYIPNIAPTLNRSASPFTLSPTVPGLEIERFCEVGSLQSLSERKFKS